MPRTCGEADASAFHSEAPDNFSIFILKSRIYHAAASSRLVGARGIGRGWTASLSPDIQDMFRLPSTRHDRASAGK
jgi:hypothetical protein